MPNANKAVQTLELDGCSLMKANVKFNLQSADGEVRKLDMQPSPYHGETGSCLFLPRHSVVSQEEIVIGTPCV